MMSLQAAEHRLFSFVVRQKFKFQRLKPLMNTNETNVVGGSFGAHFFGCFNLVLILLKTVRLNLFAGSSA